MAAKVPTYIPSPNWDIPADSSIVVLGRFIKDPKDPQSKVPASSADPTPPPEVFEGEKIDWHTNLERLRSGSIGLWVKCLQFIQGQLSLSQIKSSLEDHKFAILETKYFLPDDDYIALALKDEGVQAYFYVHNWQKPVYLITGIKIARRASVDTESSTNRSFHAEVEVNPADIDLQAGPKASLESKKKRGISYSGSTDYVFAYQLTRMFPKRKGQEISSKGFVKGALFGKDEESSKAEVKFQDNFDIEEEVDLGFLDTWEPAKTDL
ncbi:hypothetical protein F4777DRAFT_558285 [Nemania sp. FL0916]|nr:hypothetical protein F4777DRAFT_558285 [Nemania sp. FL0916]